MRHRGITVFRKTLPDRNILLVFYPRCPKLAPVSDDSKQKWWLRPSHTISLWPGSFPTCAASVGEIVNKQRLHICTEIHSGLSGWFPYLKERSYNLVSRNKQNKVQKVTVTYAQVLWFQIRNQWGRLKLGQGNRTWPKDLVISHLDQIWLIKLQSKASLGTHAFPDFTLILGPYDFMTSNY